MSGLFISFEGLDGCGKSRQMEFFAEYLRSCGYDPLLTREPGGSGIAEQIREVLLDTSNRQMDPWTEALLYAAARRQHVEEVIRPALAQGKIVLCDRFVDSSVAYQGCGRQLGMEEVAALNERAVDGCLPDATVFLDCTPDEAKSRRDGSEAPDRLEENGAAFFTRVRNGFMKLAAQHPDRIIRIDASGPKDATRALVRDALRNLLNKKGIQLA